MFHAYVGTMDVNDTRDQKARLVPGSCSIITSLLFCWKTNFPEVDQ